MSLQPERLRDFAQRSRDAVSAAILVASTPVALLAAGVLRTIRRVPDGAA